MSTSRFIRFAILRTLSGRTTPNRLSHRVKTLPHRLMTHGRAMLSTTRTHETMMNARTYEKTPLRKSLPLSSSGSMKTATGTRMPRISMVSSVRVRVMAIPFPSGTFFL